MAVLTQFPSSLFDMFKFSPSAIVQEKNSGEFFRILECEITPMKIQGKKSVFNQKSYIITPLHGKVIRWSVSEDKLQLPAEFTSYSTRRSARREYKKVQRKVSRHAELTRWEALLIACQEALKI
jgi:hypothetical protein